MITRPDEQLTVVLIMGDPGRFYDSTYHSDEAVERVCLLVCSVNN